MKGGYETFAGFSLNKRKFSFCVRKFPEKRIEMLWVLENLAKRHDDINRGAIWQFMHGGLRLIAGSLADYRIHCCVCAQFLLMTP